MTACLPDSSGDNTPREMFSGERVRKFNILPHGTTTAAAESLPPVLKLS